MTWLHYERAAQWHRKEASDFDTLTLTTEGGAEAPQERVLEEPLREEKVVEGRVQKEGMLPEMLPGDLVCHSSYDLALTNPAHRLSCDRDRRVSRDRDLRDRRRSCDRDRALW